MTLYIAKKENLKLVMNLLKDKSRNLQLEAFHIFKVPPRLALTSDLRRQPAEGPPHRHHPQDEQGQADQLHGGLPQRQEQRPALLRGEGVRHHPAALPLASFRVSPNRA